MPFVSVTTNKDLDSGQSEALLSELTKLVAAKLNKPVEYVQVCVSSGQKMCFAGTMEPSAFIELRAISLNEDQAALMSAELTKLIQNSLSISSERIFLNLLDVPRTRWGWNGSTFG